MKTFLLKEVQHFHLCSEIIKILIIELILIKKAAKLKYQLKGFL